MHVIVYSKSPMHDLCISYSSVGSPETFVDCICLPHIFNLIYIQGKSQMYMCIEQNIFLFFTGTLAQIPLDWLPPFKLWLHEANHHYSSSYVISNSFPLCFFVGHLLIFWPAPWAGAFLTVPGSPQGGITIVTSRADLTMVTSSVMPTILKWTPLYIYYMSKLCHLDVSTLSLLLLLKA